MAFELPELPYPQNGLAPHISGETLGFHHGKHHNAYVTNLNNLTEGTPWADKSLDEIVKTAEGGIFNNGAQVWNHSFYWKCMKPGGGGDPLGSRTFTRVLEDSFGSVEEFKAAFTQAAMTQFGSGWAWLVLDGGELKITKTANAGNPMTDGAIPLLTIDVWEHAYYVDFRNARPAYIETFLKHLVNWDFVCNNFDTATNA